MRVVLPFILCGGAGTRLWPLSREAFPKQFHSIGTSKTLFQESCLRLRGAPFGKTTILANRKHRFLIADQLDEVGIESGAIVLERDARNTAPTACIAALMAMQLDPDALLLLAPSDHLIADGDAFKAAIVGGIEAAEAGKLVLFGVTPNHAHTGYGYILTEDGDGAARKVTGFAEKPPRELAQRYLDSGDADWNAGLFLAWPKTLLELFETHAPEILEACRRAVDEAIEDLGFIVLGKSYGNAPSTSLDYAVVEKADNLACVKLGTAWSDVGSWQAIADALPKDDAGNSAQGDGNVLFEGTENSLALSCGSHVALLGLDNVVVVASEDAVLVASEDHVQDVKMIVERLKANGSATALAHARVYRPWGWYQTLAGGAGYQVKCIMVKPGGALSLQSHERRAEHWIVVKGALEVTKDDKVELLGENQSTYIAIGKKHRLANPGAEPAFLIEVQSGAYLGEDDIVRFEDAYGRGADD
jgi:mannose-1-phosphate guanylyltransferase/mannose-6-phosphate isomerase